MIEHILDHHFQCETGETILTIGNFDGIHRGHHTILDRMKHEARGRRTVILTFTPHPITFFSGKPFPLIVASVDEKRKQILNTGIDRPIIQQFDETISSLEPEQFLQILKDKLHVTTIITGRNFRFGKKRRGDASHIEAAGIEVIQIDDVPAGEDLVSSSRIREMLQNGEMVRVNQLLTTPFTLTGEVIKGFQRGRELGFPTANLEIKEVNQIIPATGIYISEVLWRDQLHPALTSIGYNPTFGNVDKTVETFLIDFDHDLYNQKISVMLQKKIRDEERFNSLEALIEQMNRDLDLARNHFAR